MAVFANSKQEEKPLDDISRGKRAGVGGWGGSFHGTPLKIMSHRFLSFHLLLRPDLE